MYTHAPHTHRAHNTAQQCYVMYCVHNATMQEHSHRCCCPTALYVPMGSIHHRTPCIGRCLLCMARLQSHELAPRGSFGMTSLTPQCPCPERVTVALHCRPSTDAVHLLLARQVVQPSAYCYEKTQRSDAQSCLQPSVARLSLLEGDSTETR